MSRKTNDYDLLSFVKQFSVISKIYAKANISRIRGILQNEGNYEGDVRKLTSAETSEIRSKTKL